MRRSEGKAKSGRKPLRELSKNCNNFNGGGRRVSKSEAPEKKISQEDGSLDRLLLVQCNLSSLLQQIDELVAQAFKLNPTNKLGIKEIESFTDILSEMLSSLKPWVPRFHKVISDSAKESGDQCGKTLARKAVSLVNEKVSFEEGSPEESKLESLISPSPLVSWRADCNVERGKQLFLLTPLSMSKTSLPSRSKASSKSVIKRIASSATVELPPVFDIPIDANDDFVEGLAINPTPRKPCYPTVVRTSKELTCRVVASPVISKGDHSMFFMTTNFKVSPPKSCAMFEPICESSLRGNEKAHRSTPFPLRVKNCSGSTESSGSEMSEDLTFKYPELRGIHKTYIAGVEKKELESSPNWLFSPPKSCVLLVPPDDDKTHDKCSVNHVLPVISALDQRTNVSMSKVNDDFLEGLALKRTSIKHSASLVAGTPKEIKSGVISPMISKGDHTMIVVAPHFKMSPPPSRVLLESICESSDRGNERPRTHTPFPLGVKNCSAFSDSPGSDTLEDLTLKYPELRGLQNTYRSEIGKKELESSPEWLFSPPKSCVLLVPPDDDKTMDNFNVDHHLPVIPASDQQTNLSMSRMDDDKDSCQQAKTCKEEHMRNSLQLIESTPMWRTPGNTVQRWKRPGESTLKKELWTKFEEASTYGLQYDTHACQRTARKGFLDMLDEVSSDECSPVSDGMR